jgi:glycerol-3-phosphate acyltransferase PlsX
LAKPAFRAVKQRVDYREYGGAPLLGVNGVVIIAHGRSDELAIESAIRVAIDAVKSDLVDKIRQGTEDAMTVLANAMPTASKLTSNDIAAEIQS